MVAFGNETTAFPLLESLASFTIPESSTTRTSTLKSSLRYTVIVRCSLSTSTALGLPDTSCFTNVTTGAFASVTTNVPWISLVDPSEK